MTCLSQQYFITHIIVLRIMYYVQSAAQCFMPPSFIIFRKIARQANVQYKILGIQWRNMKVGIVVLDPMAGEIPLKLRN